VGRLRAPKVANRQTTQVTFCVRGVYKPPIVKPEKTWWDSQAVNEIDRYVYAKLAKEGLSPSAEADRETLINRVSLDLTGLPPTLDEVDAFVNDKDPNAYEKLVDRLLASAEYAERQTNIWLDVARYADTRGGLNDNERPITYPYRDWVMTRSIATCASTSSSPGSWPATGLPTRPASSSWPPPS
jgi:hypothetical protein